MPITKEHRDYTATVVLPRVLPNTFKALSDSRASMAPLSHGGTKVTRNSQVWERQSFSQTGCLSSNENATILSIGDDPKLLETRHLVLESAGYHVLSISSAGLIEDNPIYLIDAVIVCHTVRLDRIRRIIARLRKLNPVIPVLSLGVPKTVQHEIHDYALDLMEGPKMLLKKIEVMLNETRNMTDAKQESHTICDIASGSSLGER